MILKVLGDYEDIAFKEATFFSRNAKSNMLENPINEY